MIESNHEINLVIYKEVIIKYTEGCIVCGEELNYSNESVTATCSICGGEFETNMICKNGHYVCDGCHSKDALDVIFDYCKSTDETNPLEISMRLMEDSRVNLHGPEHHYMIPAVLITSYCNQYESKDIKVERLKTAKERASTVPGGYCGFHGSCGAGVGAGIFASVISEATPLTRDSWGFANKMTGYVLYALGEIGGLDAAREMVGIRLLRPASFCIRRWEKNYLTIVLPDQFVTIRTKIKSA